MAPGPRPTSASAVRDRSDRVAVRVPQRVGQRQAQVDLKPLAGAAAGDNDVDGGVTTIQSPLIAIPAGGTVTLSLAFYFAHATNSSVDDFFRVEVVGATNSKVIEELGSTANDDAAFTTRAVDISAFPGQSVRIRISASDAAGASLVEVAVDDVVITRQ